MRNFYSFILASSIYSALIFLIFNQESSSYSLPTVAIDWQQVSQLNFTDTDPILEMQKAEEAQARAEAEKKAQAEKAKAEERAREIERAKEIEKIEELKKIEEKRIADLREKQKKKVKKEPKKNKQEVKKVAKKVKKVEKTKQEGSFKAQENFNNVNNFNNLASFGNTGSKTVGFGTNANGSNFGAKNGSSGKAGGKGKGSGENSANYNKALQALINKNCQRRYPKREERNGVSASLAVAFSVSPNGALTNIRISRSSGNSVFDEAALAGVRAVGTFRPTPDGNSRAFNIPISFRPRR